jgi:hypothetical protein
LLALLPIPSERAQGGIKIIVAGRERGGVKVEVVIVR